MCDYGYIIQQKITMNKKRGTYMQNTKNHQIKAIGECIEIQFAQGCMIARPCVDDTEYPGIKIEFIKNTDDGQNASRPKIRMEIPDDTKQVRVLV